MLGCDVIQISFEFSTFENPHRIDLLGEKIKTLEKDTRCWMMN